MQEESLKTSGYSAESPFGPWLSQESFWVPLRSGEGSGWVEHAPFAFWLTSVLRPRQFVELGSHTGYSYSAFCQAVQNLNLDTKCYAIDTWQGDDHAGHYGEDVYDDLFSFNNHYFAKFSRLVRSTFKQALEHFENESIDLLHIDGRHGYDDVRMDYIDWLPKLSHRAVVIFHDTNVHERNFGVSRFWDEIRQDKPHFTFLHGNGLGIIAHGNVLDPRLQTFFDCSAQIDLSGQIREAYSRLGSALTTRYSALILHNDYKKEVAAKRAAEQAAETELLSVRKAAEIQLSAVRQAAETELFSVRQELSQHSARINYLHALLGDYTHQTEVAVMRQSQIEATLIEERNLSAQRQSQIEATLVEERNLNAQIARDLEAERDLRQKADTTADNERGRRHDAECHLTRLRIVNRDAVIDRLVCHTIVEGVRQFQQSVDHQLDITMMAKNIQFMTAERDELRVDLSRIIQSRSWRMMAVLHRIIHVFR